MKNIKPFIFALVCALFIVGCNSVNQTKSPTETLKALNEASKKKDTAAIKILLTKGTLDLLEKNAKKQNKSVDEILLKDNAAPFQELPETRNEVITGETATVEVKNSVTNEFQKLPFVNENGVWKVALDKFLEDIMKQMREEMNKIPANTSIPENANQSKAESKSSNTNSETNKK
ncbi:MAG: hypothetical protein ABIP06_00255 [Pyrinomonadaceae bacterium]